MADPYHGTDGGIIAYLKSIVQKSITDCILQCKINVIYFISLICI